MNDTAYKGPRDPVNAPCNVPPPKPSQHPMPVVKTAWRRWQGKRPKPATLRKIRGGVAVLLGLLGIGLMFAQMQSTAQEPTPYDPMKAPNNAPNDSEQVIEETDSLPSDENKISFGVTVYTDIKLDGMGGGLGAVVWECPPGHTPRTGGCTSKPPSQPVPGCLTWGLHFVDRHDNIVCNGAPHVFPNLTYWISGADGVPYLVQDWTPVWRGAQPWECFPRPTFTVKTSDVAIYPPCSPTPTPRPTATPTPRPTPTPSRPPSPTPIACGQGSHYCPPVWYYDPGCGWYWTNGGCCPNGWDCEVIFRWFTCYNTGCCTGVPPNRVCQ